ncbi:hypothetical protein HUT06_40635 [Actinomadura sp. NAK00032]|uniref:SMI1/KNR4 family protein n=1 Tax=Actinomadura sp. NAK00032 TaxID=2742128 RepID=UPI0015908F59|nr:SMI1/KNR4 family protein [Actinomadura sp. NAK00032]QKW39561.1 hypothetical protein HUT06_40635 [Actinomadura sp. NAK00032]
MPALLVEMLDDGRWHHPGQQALDRVVPWRDEPVQLFTTIGQMEQETAGLSRETEDDELARMFWVARRSAQAEPVELPWLDIDRALLIGGARYSDCIAIALDYRPDAEDPQVVVFGEEMVDLHQGNRWPRGWRVVAPTFPAFVAALNLSEPAG